MSVAREDEAIAAALLRAYRTAVVPGGGRPSFHIKGRAGWIAATRKGTKRASLLSDYYIHRHLHGGLTVAPRWSLEGKVRHAVIDVDNHITGAGKKRREAGEDFERRVRALIRCLRSIQFVLVRSSKRGVHFYIFFDRLYEAVEVRVAVVGMLERCGLKVKPGSVEVWPNNSALRLPLGRGSCILEPATMRPLHAWLDRGRRLHRNVPLAVQHFVHLARTSRIPLDKVLSRRARTRILTGQSPGEKCQPEEAPPRRETVSEEREVHRSKKTTPHTSHHSPKERSNSYHDDLQASAQGVSEEGLRYEQSSRRVFDLYIRQERSREETLTEHERWLVDGNHKSKDLTSRRDSTITRMLRDAARYIDHLQGRVDRGDLVRGRSGCRALSLLLGGVRQHTDWREVAQRALTPLDKLLLRQVDDPVVRRHLGVLLGLLRIGSRDRPIRRITLSSKALDLIAGKRMRTLYNRFNGRPLRESIYNQMLRAAEKIGVVSFVSLEERGRHARIYEVWLPERETACVRCARKRPLAKQARYCPGSCKTLAWRSRRRDASAPT